MPERAHFDVMVIGGGSGLTAASHALEDGKSVALVDSKPDALGGTCLNRGCIPTKGLIQAADVLRTVRNAGEFGVRVDGEARPDFGAIMKTMRDRRSEAAGGVRSWVEDAMTPVFGEARFVDEKVVEVEGRAYSADRVFLATGARPKLPPVPGLDEVDPLTNESVLELTELPERLVILGGGYIGCEFGYFFAMMGSDVTVVDRSSCLTKEDDDVRSLFTEKFGELVDLRLGSSAVEARRADGRVELDIEREGTGETLHADAILVATGRRPNTDSLDLVKTGVKVDDAGWIRADDHLRTTHPDIYAYGDVIGREMFKHTSSAEGGVAYRNSQGADLSIDYTANPHAVFAHPRIAGVGLTEQACRERGLGYRTGRTEYSGFAKGRIIGSPPGFAKVIIEEGTDRILGFHVIGPEADLLVHEVVVAMNADPERSARLVRESIHTHPTLSELVSSVFADAG